MIPLVQNYVTQATIELSGSDVPVPDYASAKLEPMRAPAESDTATLLIIWPIIGSVESCVILAGIRNSVLGILIFSRSEEQQWAGPPFDSNHSGLILGYQK